MMKQRYYSHQYEQYGVGAEHKGRGGRRACFDSSLAGRFVPAISAVWTRELVGEDEKKGCDLLPVWRGGLFQPFRLCFKIEANQNKQPQYKSK